MFKVEQNDEGKWVLSWGGVVFPQTPLDTHEQAEARLGRMEKRWPGESFGIGLDVVRERRGGPYRYSFPEDYREYLAGSSVKPEGRIDARSRQDAKDIFRYRLERAGIDRDKVKALLVVLELETVR